MPGKPQPRAYSMDTRWSPEDDREAMIRLTDIVGREHIFAPYHLDTPLPAAPGVLALVRPSGHRFAGIRSIVQPPWWDVLLIRQSSNICRRAGHLLREMPSNRFGPTRVMVHWLPESREADRQAIERALIEAHDPELNRTRVDADPVLQAAEFA